MRIFSAIIFLLFSFFSQAEDNPGGISLEATRVIFVSDKNSTGLTVNNSSSKDIWLIRAWMTQYNKEGERKTPFIITPPLYRLEPDEKLQLRINSTDVSSLPTDRESVFKVNVLAIPPKTQLNNGKEKAVDELSGGYLQFAINNSIKLFYRPSELNDPASLEKSRNQLKVVRKGSNIEVVNPGPYYFTLINVKVNGSPLHAENSRDLMVSPFDSLSIPAAGAVSMEFQTINDFGASTPVMKTVF
ncbi:molecular chaperone [Salmonella enterica]|nr:molecular chaperone [Salmonella enterica subsp. enterica]EAY8717848.1 molecular chaperone [Salmonella enterica]ECI2266401.1 molecular chaperone [Salmonella enterica subsp. enterica serovar Wandsworth]EBQ1580705.1 molecular chaperone [Salmonella enterica]EHI5300800.1 molecular chaperone [Salmonella enterica]